MHGYAKDANHCSKDWIEIYIFLIFSPLMPLRNRFSFKEDGMRDTYTAAPRKRTEILRNQRQYHVPSLSLLSFDCLPDNSLSLSYFLIFPNDLINNNNSLNVSLT